MSKLTGIKKIDQDPTGALKDCPPDWTGIMAMLLRKIFKDNYDGKGREGIPQLPDEKMSIEYLESTIENTVTKYADRKLSRSEINQIKSSLMKEFGRDYISVKYLGEFFHILDPLWVDFTVVINRQSGTIKSYTVHAGGLGSENYTPPQYTTEHFGKYGTHQEMKIVTAPTILDKKLK